MTTAAATTATTGNGVHDLQYADILCRVSTEAQASEDSVSYDQQEANCRRWCEANGFRVRDVHREAKSADPGLDPMQRQLRPEFWAAWDDLVAGRIQAMIFNDRTRVVRESSSYAYYLELGRKYGAGVVVVESGYANVDGWQRKALIALDGLASEADNASRKLVFRQKKQERFARGELPQGRLPLGYLYDGGKNGTRKVQVVEEHARVVALIFDLYTSEGLSLVKLAARLRELGVPTPAALRRFKNAGRSWGLDALLHILKTATYATGVFKMPYHGTTYEISVPPLVAQHVFDRAQHLLTTHKRVRWSGERRLFSGRITCGLCGRPYYKGTWWRRSAHASVPAYYCRGKNKPLAARTGEPSCTASRVLWLDDIESRLWQTITELLADGQGLREAAEHYLAQLDRDIGAIDLGPTERRLEELRAERGRWVQAWTKFGGDPEPIERNVARIDEELAALDKQGKKQQAERERQQRLIGSRDLVRAALDSGLVNVLGIEDNGDGSVTLWLDGEGYINEDGKPEAVRKHEGDLEIDFTDAPPVAKGASDWSTRPFTKRAVLRHEKLLDLLQVSVVAHRHRLEVSGIISATLLLEGVGLLESSRIIESCESARFSSRTGSRIAGLSDVPQNCFGSRRFG